MIDFILSNISRFSETLETEEINSLIRVVQQGLDLLEENGMPRQLTKQALDLFPELKPAVEARNRIILLNQKLAFFYLKRKYRTSDEDLFQEMILALDHAINNFDLSRKVKFSVYAYFCFFSRFYNYSNKQKKIVSAPINAINIIRKIERFESEFYQANSRPPTVEEVCAEFKLTHQKYLNYKSLEDSLSLHGSFRSSSASGVPPSIEQAYFVSDEDLLSGMIQQEAVMKAANKESYDTAPAKLKKKVTLEQFLEYCHALSEIYSSH